MSENADGFEEETVHAPHGSNTRSDFSWFGDITGVVAMKLCQVRSQVIDRSLGGECHANKVGLWVSDEGYSIKGSMNA